MILVMYPVNIAGETARFLIRYFQPAAQGRGMTLAQYHKKK